MTDPGFRSAPSRLQRRLGVAALALSVAALVGSVAAAAAPSASAAPPRFVGLQGWNEPTAQQFGRLNRAKVQLWRQNLSWKSVEKKRGRYTWGRYDRLFSKAGANNVRIFPVLIGSPPWARSRPQYPPNETHERRAFYRFARAAVKRYGPHGTFWARKPRFSRDVRPIYWQVWNEPNLPNYWNGKVDPPAYGRFLMNTSKAANAADPDVQIVSAGLPQTTCSSGPCIDDFLRSMYTVDGIGKWIDAVAVHTYTGDVSGIFYRMRLARDQTIRSLGKSKKLWITEFGWATGGSHRYFSTSHSGQASRLRDAYEELMDEKLKWRLAGAIWFGYKDPPRGDSWQYHTGLFDREWRPKPAWETMADVAGGRP